MKRVVYLVLSLGVIIGTVAYWRHRVSAPKEEGLAHLTPQKVEPFSGTAAFVSPSSVYLSAGRPQQLIDLPLGITENTPDIFYFQISVGSQKVFCAIQYLTSNKVTAWLDKNLNNQLSDEQPQPGIPRSTPRVNNDTLQYYDFGQAIISDGSNTSSPFQMVSTSKYDIRLYPAFCSVGNIRLGCHGYQITLLDGDYDNAYYTHFIGTDDVWYWGCDTLVLSPIKHRWLGHDTDSDYMPVPLGRYYKLDEQYYSVTITPDGKTVRMAPAEPAFGTLSIGNKIHLSGRLYSDAATQEVDFIDTISLPEGRYRIVTARLIFSNHEEQERQLFARFYNNSTKGYFEILKGQTTVLNPGPPFTIQTDIRKSDSDELSINANLIGKEGESYDLRISRSPDRPKLQILAENGDTLHTDSMEYG